MPRSSSHGPSSVLLASKEPKHENIKVCTKYFKHMAPLGICLEMEIGITSGEEDGMDNTCVDKAALYTQPTDVWDVFTMLNPIL